MHVAHPAFGEGVNCIDMVLGALKTAPPLVSTDTQLLLMEQYEKTYKICDHDMYGLTRPLALIAMHPSEDTSTNSALHDMIDKFADLNVYKYFGLSFDKFLELPSETVNKVLEVCAKRNKVEGAITNDMLRNLENSGKV